MSEIPGLDLRIIYLAAGHTETGGAQVPPLSEGRENMQVVDDAVGFLHPGEGRPVTDGIEYDLNGIPLVVLDHSLDLMPGIQALNADYRARGLAGWDQGICIEVHHNWVNDRSVQGPTSVYSEWAPSRVLGDVDDGYEKTAHLYGLFGQKAGIKFFSLCFSGKGGSRYWSWNWSCCATTSKVWCKSLP